MELAQDGSIWSLLDARPEDSVAWVAGAAALVVVLMPSLWRPARNLVTIVHEAGHALAGLLAGRRLQGIRLHSDTSGVTVSRGKTTGPGMVLTTLAGYPAPALLGVGFAALLTAGRMPLVLVFAALVLLGVLVMVRNAYGVFAVVVASAVLAVVALVAPPGVQTAFVYFITWFLLLAGVRPVFELQAKRRRGIARDSDADQLARLTGVPAALWFLVLGVLTLGCLVVGGSFLVDPVLN